MKSSDESIGIAQKKEIPQKAWIACLWDFQFREQANWA